MAQPEQIQDNNTLLGKINPVCPPFSASAANEPNFRPPLVIDPKNPFGSLTAGNQQFTILGDTNHQKPEIGKAILDNIEAMAKSGVKHIMIEFDLPEKSEVERAFPEFKDKSLTERLDILRQQKTLLEAEQFKALNDFLKENPGYNNEKAIDKTALEFTDRLMRLDNAERHLIVHDTLDRLYAEPRQITNDEIRQRSKYFRSSNPVTEEERTASGQHLVETLIKSRELGMRVHYTGDTVAHQYDAPLEQIDFELRWLRRENPKLAEYEKEVMKGNFGIVPQEDRTAYSAYMDQTIALSKRSLDLGDQLSAERTDIDAERARAETFLTLAGGEKAVIFWGAGHAHKQNDFNEILDERLRAEALKNGTLDKFAPTRTMEIHTSAESHNMNLYLQGDDKPDLYYFVQEKQIMIPASPSNTICLKEDAAPTAPPTPPVPPPAPR